MLTAKEIQQAIDTGDMSILGAVCSQYGTSTAGSVAHAAAFPQQARDGNSVAHATVRAAADLEPKLSCEALAARLSAAALTLGHGLSKKGYNAFYSASCGMPASYDTIMRGFKALLSQTVRDARFVSLSNCGV